MIKDQGFGFPLAVQIKIDVNSHEMRENYLRFFKF